MVYPAHSGRRDARHLTQGDARGLACPGLRNAGPLGLRMVGALVFVAPVRFRSVSVVSGSRSRAASRQREEKDD
jgi:hypothetical protein